jgi:hypothetical protein
LASEKKQTGKRIMFVAHIFKPSLLFVWKKKAGLGL